MRIIYVNGRYLPYTKAFVHVQDRGYQFADGVYEVCRAHNSRIFGEQEHIDRLWRSLKAISLAPPVSQTVLKHILREVLRRNNLPKTLLYFQVTRGQAPRNHAFPHVKSPSLVVTATPLTPLDTARVITVPDTRWKRCDIKSIALLPNVLARQKAQEKGAQEAWFVNQEGKITEGAGSNAWIVSSSGSLITHPVGNAILDGVVRRLLLDLAKKLHIPVEERPFMPREAYMAPEAFFSASSSFVVPVVQIDEHTIGNGKVGAVTSKLQRLGEHT